MYWAKNDPTSVIKVLLVEFLDKMKKSHCLDIIIVINYNYITKLRLDIKKPVEEDEYEEVDDNQEKEKKKKKKSKKDGEENEEEREGEENEEEKNDEEKGEDEEGNEDEEAADGEILDEEMGEEEEEGGGFVVEEENLDFERFLFRYTHPQVLKSYILMLGEYAKNSDFLNRCCMSMFERIAYECKAPQCLYQLSLFSLINRIYKDPLSRCIMSITDNASHKPHRYYNKKISPLITIN